MKKVEEEIKEIKERNKRVELDKKWETSLTRKVCIAILTYIVVVIYSYMDSVPKRSSCQLQAKRESKDS